MIDASAKKKNRQAKSPAKPKPKKKRIMFVCTGNTCRSPMAEYIFKDILKKHRRLSEFSVSSSGVFASLGTKMSFFSLSALKSLSINGEKFNSRLFKPAMIKSVDLIITMTQGHKNAIGQYPNVFTLAELTSGGDISDPYGGSQESYDRVCAELLIKLNELYDKVFVK